MSTSISGTLVGAAIPITIRSDQIVESGNNANRGREDRQARPAIYRSLSQQSEPFSFIQVNRAGYAGDGKLGQMGRSHSRQSGAAPLLRIVQARANDFVRGACDLLGTGNLGGKELLGLASKALSDGATELGIMPEIKNLSNNVKHLIADPKNEQAKWDVGNAAAHLAGGLAATAASFAFPPAALAPLLLPNFSEIHHAEDLRHEVNRLRAQGRNTEADAMHTIYQEAALNATPIINWFGSVYKSAMQPAIETFELSQGNRPDAPSTDGVPQGLADNAGDVAGHYYASALSERAKSFANNARSELKALSQKSGMDTVTILSRAPQLFVWPSTGQPMRAFDKAIAITYSKRSDSVSAQFLSPGKHGRFNVPLMDGVTTAPRMKNLVVVGNMLDPDKMNVQFDLSLYRDGKVGNLAVADPRHYAV
ncbi:hypothetical protein bAD24_III03680 [Burkholderia sp. AD24]|nr:hypothetical protein bAD24_III03680 [Burkholderia sp. AD24]